jgi:hypothetical protein
MVYAPSSLTKLTLEGAAEPTLSLIDCSNLDSVSFNFKYNLSLDLTANTKLFGVTLGTQFNSELKLPPSVKILHRNMHVTSFYKQ